MGILFLARGMGFFFCFFPLLAWRENMMLVIGTMECKL